MMTLIRTFILSCLMLVSAFSIAQYSDFSISFRNGSAMFKANANELRGLSQLSPSEIYNGKFYRFVQFFEIPNEAQKKAMEAIGIDFLEYIPNKVYIVAIPTQLNFNSWTSLGIRAIYPIGIEHKMDKRLEERPLPLWALSGQELNVFVQIYGNIAANLVQEELRVMGYKILETDNFANTLVTRIPLDKLEEFAQLPFVRFLDLPSEPGVPESDDGRNLHRANLIDRDYYGTYAYDGTGVNVAVNDDGPVGPHIDFTGRVNQQTAGTGTGTHGDMVAGIVGGAGNLNPIMRGMAVGAYMHIRSYSSTLPGTLALHQDSAVLLFSSSYSNGCNAGYTTLTRTVDQQIYDNPFLMQVFSGGNSNGQDCGYGAGTQWGNITGGHKMGKNVIATANLRNNDVIETSSSRGPANDGRIKPDISAHGTNQMSTDPNNTYAAGGGTSAACPGITGVMSQLHQAYRDMNSNNTAPSALIKACLLNSANDLGNDGPDFIFGWGKVNTFKALRILEENRYLSSTISQGGLNVHNITIPANVSRVRVMVYWNDKEASTSAARALVNDININVSSPSATVHYPWILNSAANTTTLAQPATRNGVLDTLNNVEQVAIDNPSAGVYTVNVSGAAIPFGPQTYYLVWEFLTDDIMVTFPVGGEGLLPGTSDRIHWDAYGNNGTFRVEISTDNGNNWSVLAASSGASTRFISYTVPNTLTGQARVRVTRNGISDESDANFSIIARPQNLRVAAACNSSSSIRLAWDPVAGATGYDVFKLGTMYMDSVGSTSGALSFDVPVPNINASYWFAVRALGPNGCIGLRTIAIQYQGNITGNSCLIDCNNDNDAGVANILSPIANQQSCNGSAFDVSIMLTNIGQPYQTNFPVYYSINNGTPVMETFTDTLFGNSQRNFMFSQQLQLPSAGVYQLKVWTALSTDGTLCNDTMEIQINFSNPISIFPYNEDFQAANFPPVNSYLINPDGSKTWNAKICTGSNGNSTRAMFMDNYTYEETGEKDYFGLINMDLTNAAAADLFFDLSYAQYSSTYRDTLQIEISTDCGQTFNTIYSKTSASLATTANSTSAFTPSSAAQWRNESINLNAYTGNYIAIRFVSINGYGNNIYVDNINIRNFNAAPIASFNQNLTTVCAGTAVSFTDLSSGNPNSWSWNFGDGGVSTQQNPAHTYQSGGVYDVRLISSNPVGTDTAFQVALINVLQPIFTFDAGALNVDFFDASIGANSWSWNFGDGSSSTIQNPSHNYAAPGNYTVSLQINGQCTYSELISVGSVDLSVLGNDIFSVELIPNPATDLVRIDFKEVLKEEVNLQLISLDGRLLQEYTVSSASKYFDLNCTKLLASVYFVRLKSGDYTVSKKLVIKR